MTWVLILAVYMGTGTAAVTIPGYATKQECDNAGIAAVKVMSGGLGAGARHVCVPAAKP